MIAAEPNKHQQKSERTRERLLDATVDCLVELGYARTTVNVICIRAGLSRGAQLHHFPTKAQLMAAAVEHLVHKQTDRLGKAVQAVPSGQQRDAVMVDLLWEAFSGPLASASMQLWTAATTDAELRSVLLPVERRLGRFALELFRSYTGQAAETATERDRIAMFWLTVNLVRGLALDEMLGGDAERRRDLLERWKALSAAASSRGTTTNGGSER